jgi:two-component system, chemotaxis family, protein-glutamate methylesterase/glutaminase
MDGLTTLVELRKLYPKLPVIMFSTLTQRGAEATIDALSKGANDYVTKPSNVGSVTAAIQNVRNELIPKIKAFCPWTSPPPVVRPQRAESGGFVNARITRPGPVRTGRIDVVAIGVSTGGPNALQTVIPKLPASLAVPVIIVQHMPPIFTKHLADRLNQLSPLEVCEAASGDIVQAGRIFIAPGDFHLVTRREGTTVRTVLNKCTPENSCRPAVDVMFRAVAETYGANVLAVVLTGMGQDGAKGCGVIRDRGGRTLVQDEATSVVWGMPGAVANAGAADKILPLDKIAAEIVQETQQGRSVRALASMRA